MTTKYRILRKGEKIRKGDQFKNYKMDWVETGSAGSRVEDCCLTSHPYRRPVRPKRKAEREHPSVTLLREVLVYVESKTPDSMGALVGCKVPHVLWVKCKAITKKGGKAKSNERQSEHEPGNQGQGRLLP